MTTLSPYTTQNISLMSVSICVLRRERYRGYEKRCGIWKQKLEFLVRIAGYNLRTVLQAPNDTLKSKKTTGRKDYD